MLILSCACGGTVALTVAEARAQQHIRYTAQTSRSGTRTAAAAVFAHTATQRTGRIKAASGDLSRYL